MSITVEPVHDPQTARVRAMVQEVIADPPFFLVDVALRGKDGSRVVEVFVDHDDGISIEALADLSREIGFLLDTEEVIKGRYYLNVSSPGADRPLVHPRQFLRHRGRPARLLVRDADGNEQTVRGVIGRSDAESVELLPAGGEPRVFRFDVIDEARIELPW